MLLQFLLDAVELCIDFRHSLLHGRILGSALLLRDACTLCPALRTDLSDLLWCADTCNHVLTLCVHKILTVEEVLTVTGIAAEAYTRSRGVTHVTEYHGHDADGSTPLVGDAFHLTIEDGTLVHPAAEHSADSAPKLLNRVVREVLARTLLDSLLEELHKLLELVYREVLVENDTTLLLHLLDDFLERVDVLFVHRLHLKNDVTVHLYETAIRIVNEVRVVGLLHHTFSHLIVKTEVEDGVHHTRHRGTCT